MKHYMSRVFFHLDFFVVCEYFDADYLTDICSEITWKKNPPPNMSQN